MGTCLRHDYVYSRLHLQAAGFQAKYIRNRDTFQRKSLLHC